VSMNQSGFDFQVDSTFVPDETEFSARIGNHTLRGLIEDVCLTIGMSYKVDRGGSIQFFRNGKLISRKTMQLKPQQPAGTAQQER
jgi:hypothetical protein